MLLVQLATVFITLNSYKLVWRQKMKLNPYIVSQIKKNEPKYTQLDLSYSDLCDEAIDELVDLLEDNKFITTINLKGNNLTAEGAKILATLCLASLDVSENSIGNEGVEYLIASPGIKDLNIQDNGASPNVIRNANAKRKGISVTSLNSTATKTQYNSTFNQHETLMTTTSDIEFGFFSGKPASNKKENGNAINTKNIIAYLKSNPEVWEKLLKEPELLDNVKNELSKESLGKFLCMT